MQWGKCHESKKDDSRRQRRLSHLPRVRHDSRRPHLLVTEVVRALKLVLTLRELALPPGIVPLPPGILFLVGAAASQQARG
jgi:hypothetical protein